MQKRIQIKQLIILIILFGATVQLTIAQKQNDVTVKSSASIVPALSSEKLTNVKSDCEEELKVSQQRLVKTLDALDKAELLIASLKQENEALTRLNAINGQIQTAQAKTIEAQKAEIEIYKAKSQRKISLLWGIIKIRY